MRIKVLLIIFLVSLGLISYLVLTSKLISIKGDNEVKEIKNKKEIVNKIEEEERKFQYEEKIKEIITGCDNLYEDVSETFQLNEKDENNQERDDINEEEVINLKNRAAVIQKELMELKVPLKEDQDRHLKLVLALDSLGEYLDTENESTFLGSKELFIETKSKFD